LQENYFYNTIHELRKNQVLTLFDDTLLPEKKEIPYVVDFLYQEYQQESKHYPYESPKFDVAAGEWASLYVYQAAGYYLSRKDNIKDVKESLKNYEGAINAASLLSADLTLRFLPTLYQMLKNIDSEDPILQLIEEVLASFHYSAIGFIDIAEEKLENMNVLFQNKSFKNIYLHRVYERKAYKLAELPIIRQGLSECFGNYQKKYWPELI
jgi:hypothetical protein